MAINLLTCLQSITRQIPDLVTVTYEPRGAGDAFGSGVAFEARRQPLTDGDAGDLAKRWCRWQLYATASQTVQPGRLGRITGPTGERFNVHVTQSRFGNLIFDCDCIQEVKVP